MRNFKFAIAFVFALFTYSFPAKAVIVEIGGDPTWDENGCRVVRDCSLCLKGWLDESFCCIEKKGCDNPDKEFPKRKETEKTNSTLWGVRMFQMSRFLSHGERDEIGDVPFVRGEDRERRLDELFPIDRSLSLLSFKPDPYYEKVKEERATMAAAITAIFEIAKAFKG